MSSLSDRILEQLKAAMKAKDTLTLSVLRNLMSALKYAAIERGDGAAELDDNAALAVVRKEIKKRQDAADSFERGQRPELARQERDEIGVLERYLPPALSPDQVEALIEETVAELGATSRQDMGRVMKALQERTGGAVDNRELSQKVMARLS